MADPIVTKRCKSCDTTHPVGNFYRRKNGRLYYRCKGCEKRARRPARPVRIVSAGCKECISCKAERPDREFYSDVTRKDGLSPYCKSCHTEKRSQYSNKPEIKARQKAYNKSYHRKRTESGRSKAKYRANMQDPEKRAKHKTRANAYYHATKDVQRIRQIARKYGLTKDEYESMAQQQSDKCAVCRRLPTNKVLVVDHDHETGDVRGLLCGRCNRAFGLLGDDPAILEAGSIYLRQRTHKPQAA